MKALGVGGGERNKKQQPKTGPERAAVKKTGICLGTCLPRDSPDFPYVCQALKLRGQGCAQWPQVTTEDFIPPNFF